MSRPQVIEDAEHERIYERVAAVDVAKETSGAISLALSFASFLIFRAS